MGAIKQHAAARQLLPLIEQAVKTRDWLTYKSAAIVLGRSKPGNSRMVAQVCDLLDAATALAGVPLVALIAVRESRDGNPINRKAWHGPSGTRDAIIRRSERHIFTRQDFLAIVNALDRLSGRGNRKAWTFVRDAISEDQLMAQLTGQDAVDIALAIATDAIADIGSDRPMRVEGVAYRYARDPRIRSALITRAAGKCEFCGEEGFLCEDGERYLESHHIVALASDGSDLMTNVVALCPRHHREAHYGARKGEMEQRMIAIVTRLEGSRR